MILVQKSERAFLGFSLAKTYSRLWVNLVCLLKGKKLPSDYDYNAIKP
jgi:hypothetical protein